MHVAFVNPQGNFDPNDSYWTAHPDFGGQLVYVKELALAMGNLGHKVGAVVLEKLAGTEVYRSIQDIQLPRVSVEFFWKYRYLRLGEFYHSLYFSLRLRTHGVLCECLAGLFIPCCRGLLVDPRYRSLSPLEDRPTIIHEPVAPCIDQPAPPRVAVPKIPALPCYEPPGVSEIGGVEFPRGFIV